MPMETQLSLPTTEPAPAFLTLSGFKRGVISLIDKSNLPRDAMEEADNLFLYEDGQPGTRPGVNWYGTAMPNSAEIDGFDYFDFNGAIHLVAVAGGNVYRSTDYGTTWTICTGATLTSGVQVNMNQSSTNLYLTNGVDNITRYNGTTTLQTYTTLITPSAPTVVKTGLGATTYNYYYKVSAVNDVGFTAASATGSIAVSATRNTWDTTTNFVTLTFGQTTGATRYDIFLSEDNVNFYYINSIVQNPAGATNTFKDDGSSIVIISTIAPTGNTTQGEKYEELVNVGSRQWGVRNTTNRYRIGYTGAEPYNGAFSSAYGGGSLSFQEGGKLIPKQIEDYRDGKNTPMATVWCDSADGQGGILQISLDDITIDGITITIPNVFVLPGSRGTPAPGSVVNVLNDYMFYNSQAFYNLGSRAQFLNLLSTDEASSNIRPTVKSISTAAEYKVSSIYFDAKVYFSVAYGTTNNNATIVYDTERRAWLPRAFTLGFKKFLRFTSTAVDGTKTQHLLCVKPGDNRLSEISTSIQGDYGLPFSTSLQTGLYPVNKNRFEFQFTEEGEIELSNPQGTINVELLGTERSKGFRSTNTETIETRTTNVGWDTFNWDVMNWDDTSTVPDTYSESSVKRYFTVQKELNNVQWHITTNTLDARYVLRTLQSWGTVTLAGKPRSWRIG